MTSASPPGIILLSVGQMLRDTIHFFRHSAIRAGDTTRRMPPAPPNSSALKTTSLPFFSSRSLHLRYAPEYGFSQPSDFQSFTPFLERFCKSLFIRYLECRKIQAIYFEIQGTYFKISALYFLRQAMYFFLRPEKAYKQPKLYAFIAE